MYLISVIVFAKQPTQDDANLSNLRVERRQPQLPQRDDESFQSDEAKIVKGKAQRNKPQADKRLELDNHQCVILKTANPEVCHLVPFSVNDEEDKRKNFFYKLFGTNLLFNGRAQGQRIRRYFTSSLGISDKKWNMISLERQLHHWWGKFYFGLECLGPVYLPDKPKGISTLQLRFHWMPRNTRPGQRLPRNPEDFVKVFDDILGSPSVPGHLVAAARPESGLTVQTGDIFYIDIDTIYVEKMKAAFDIQWALIKITAMAGGAEALELLDDEPDYLVNGQLRGLVALIQEGVAFNAWLETGQGASEVSSTAEELLVEDVEGDCSRDKAIDIRMDKRTDDKQADVKQADVRQNDVEQDDVEQDDVKQDNIKQDTSGDRGVDDSDKGKLKPPPKKRL